MCSPCLPHIILTTTEVDVFIPILQMRDLSLKNIELVSRGAEVRTLICLMIKPKSQVTILLPQALLFTETT